AARSVQLQRARAGRTKGGDGVAACARCCRAVRYRVQRRRRRRARRGRRGAAAAPARGRPRALPPAARTVDDMLTLLAVGRLVPKKGFDVLIDAAARLRRPFRLRIVGDGPERDALAARIGSIGLASRVSLESPLTHAELPAAYAAANVVVVPSVLDSAGDRDGLPNVVLEALAVKRAVVASDIAAIGTAIQHGRTGVLATPGDAEGL